MDIISQQEPSTHNKQMESKEDSEYVLRWSEHNNQLINVFHELCQNEEFTDVTLATADHQFKAHKLVLSACSPYFRTLLMANPCKHPVVFLKDVSDEHMRLLLEYMYRGSISVRQPDLTEILRTASSLKIRGLTTAEAPSAVPTDSHDDDAPLIVDEHINTDSFQQDAETSSNHSAASAKSGLSRRGGHEGNGRKSSVPKKLRLSDDRESEMSSPRTSSWPSMPSGQEEHHRVSPLLGGPISGSSENQSPIHNLTDTEADLVEDSDQPVDFSTTGGGSKINVAPQFSILGSYLTKAGGRATSPEDITERSYELRRAELAEDLRRAGYGSSPFLSSLEQLSSLTGGGLVRPASRDSRGDSREERNSSGEDNEIKEFKGTPPPLGSLSDTLGIDIAGRLRSHFLANLPSQSYAWLNGMAGANAPNGGLGSLSMGPLSSLNSLNGLGGGGRMPAARSEGNNRRGSTGSTGEKPDRHPLGGIRTGEIGSNGKPSVACEVCGKKLADPSSLYRHRKIHSGDKPHKCPYCPRRFIQRYNMKQHIKTHRIELMAEGGQGGNGFTDPSDHRMDLIEQKPFVEQLENKHNISA